jgi:arylformamidase
VKHLDVTLALSPLLPVWPGDPEIEIAPLARIEAGDPANVSRLNCSVHSGTHVDAPRHFVDGGQSVEELDLNILLGPAHVARIPDTVDAVGPEELERLELAPDVIRLLLRTRNSNLWQTARTEFTRDFVALTAQGAEWVVERGVRLVGVDYLSVQLFADLEPDTHLTLLGSGVIIVEGLDLGQVPSGDYELLCLPLKIDGCDGAPARVVLRVSDD